MIVTYKPNAVNFPVIASSERSDLFVIGFARTLSGAQRHLNRFYRGTGADPARATWGDREIKGQLTTVIEGR